MVTPEVKFLTSFDARRFNFGRHDQYLDARTPTNGSAGIGLRGGQDYGWSMSKIFIVISLVYGSMQYAVTTIACSSVVTAVLTGVIGRY
jgi:hypothetical protein